jgi:hypothetical protein
LRFRGFNSITNKVGGVILITSYYTHMMYYVSKKEGEKEND